MSSLRLPQKTYTSTSWSGTRRIDNTETDSDGHSGVNRVTTKILENTVSDIRASSVVGGDGTIGKIFHCFQRKEMDIGVSFTKVQRQTRYSTIRLTQGFFLDLGPNIRFVVGLVVLAGYGRVGVGCCCGRIGDLFLFLDPFISVV